MKTILLGPPGAGKGTQAQILSKELNIPHISTGDIFRKNLKEGTPLGNLAKSYMDKGELVPDSVTVAIVEDRLKGEDCKDGFMLDGFPRNLDQAKSLEEVLENMGTELDGVINFEVDYEVLVRRLTGRRVCKQCNNTTHIDFLKGQNNCQSCAGELIQRDDDKPNTVEKRLAVYREQTQPLIDYYNQKGLLFTVNGEEEIEMVTKAIKERFRRIS
jgi:adenylate kinase